MMWSDEKFDYFKTSDGYLYCVPRNLEREAAEARFERAMCRIRLMNWAFVCLVYAFVTADISVLIVLLIGGSL
jgi:hypothetical protein